MFEDTISNLHQSRDAFSSKIQDSFGKSIEDKVFEPANCELNKLEGVYSEAELKMYEINAIIMELRTII